MALIVCPECNRDVSDKVKACPHCGYPFLEESNTISQPQQVEVTAIKLKKISRRKKKIIIMNLSIVIIIIMGLLTTYYFIKTEQDREYRNAYIDNLNSISVFMLLGASDSESLTNTTAKVWYNSIYKENDSNTNKYTVKNSVYTTASKLYSKNDFYDDFNSALAMFFIDNDIIEKIDSIKTNTKLIDDLMKDLKNPTPEFEKCYNTVSELYVTYQSLTELAISPSGSYQSFADNKNKKVESFLEQYKMLQTQIPEKEGKK